MLGSDTDLCQLVDSYSYFLNYCLSIQSPLTWTLSAEYSDQYTSRPSEQGRQKYWTLNTQLSTKQQRHQADEPTAQEHWLADNRQAERPEWNLTKSLTVNHPATNQHDEQLLSGALYIGAASIGFSSITDSVYVKDLSSMKATCILWLLIEQRKLFPYDQLNLNKKARCQWHTVQYCSFTYQ